MSARLRARGPAARRPAAVHGRDAGPTSSRTGTSTPTTQVTFARVGRAVQPGRALARRARRRRRATASRSTCPNEYCLRWIVAYAAVHKAGAVMVPANTRLSVAGAGRDPRPRRGLGDVHVRRAARLGARGRGQVPSLRSILDADGPRRRRARLGRRGRARSTRGAIQVPLDADDMADIMYTSGTTGTAEGRARAAPQRRDDAERRAALDRRAAGCTARRCSRSRA